MTGGAFDPSDRFRRTPEQVNTVLDGNLVVMTLADGRYFELNPVGARIWDELAEPVLADELVTRLMAEYDVDAETCTAEVTHWLGEMQRLGLVLPA